MQLGPMSLLASPWSPPPWMKSNGRYNFGGKLLPQYRGPWSQHFVRFAEEMASRGVPLWGISVQNEPEAATPWESCEWTGDEEASFIRDFLGPAVRKAKLDLKIVAWDHNRDGMLQRAACIYSDPDVSEYVWGIGYHWCLDRSDSCSQSVIVMRITESESSESLHGLCGKVWGPTLRVVAGTCRGRSPGEQRVSIWARPGMKAARACIIPCQVNFEDALRVLAADRKLPAPVGQGTLRIFPKCHVDAPQVMKVLAGSKHLEGAMYLGFESPDAFNLSAVVAQALSGASWPTLPGQHSADRRAEARILRTKQSTRRVA